MESILSGVGVLDKAFAIVALVRSRPHTLAELVEASGQSRATTHRLATALEVHGVLRRDDRGRYLVGLATLGLAAAARDQMPLAQLAERALTQLRDTTGESAQLYVRQGNHRVCIASLQSPHGLRTIVDTGALLPLDVGSGGRALLGEAPGPQGWTASVAEREDGVASVSAPVGDQSGAVIAAVSISGPIGRLGDRPGAQHGDAVVAAARSIETALHGN